MSASVTEICNRGLQMLGAARISAITDQSVNARQCANCYYVLRDRLLRAHPWNFAIKRYQLPADAIAPAFGPSNSYTLPTGWLRVLPPDPSQNFNDLDWVIEGGAVLTNEGAPLNLRAVMKVEDATLMDPLFREALSALMAQEMAEALTQSNEKKQAAAAAYKDAVSEAKKTNAIEKVPQDAPEDSWITARMNGGGSSGAGGWGAW